MSKNEMLTLFFDSLCEEIFGETFLEEQDGKIMCWQKDAIEDISQFIGKEYMRTKGW